MIIVVSVWRTRPANLKDENFQISKFERISWPFTRFNYYVLPIRRKELWQGMVSFPERWWNLAVMVNQTYGSGAFQVLLQAVPATALVCAATIALLLLLVRILAQSLASSQHRQMQDTPVRLLHPGHFPHFQPREYDPYLGVYDKSFFSITIICR